MSEDIEPPADASGHRGQVPRPGHRVVASVLAGTGSALVVAGLSAITVRLVTVDLGPYRYGLFVTALTFVTSAMLLTDLGINALTGREIAKNPGEAAHILGHNLGLRIALSMLVIPPLVLVGHFVYGVDGMTLTWTIAVIALAIPFDAMRSVSLGYYVSTIRNYYGAPILVVQQLVYLGGILLTIRFHFGVLGCAFSFLAGTFVSGLLAFALVRREVPFRVMFGRQEWRKVIGQSLSLGAIQVINMFYLRAATLLLSVMATPRDVGLYGVAYAFIVFFATIPTLIMTSLIPLLTLASAENLQRLVQRSLHILAASGTLIAVGMVLFAPEAVLLLAGRHFLPAATALRILGVSCIPTFIANPYGYAAVARNRHHRMIWVSLIGLLLNIVFNVALIPTFGITGSAWASLASEVLALAGIQYVYTRDVGTKVSVIRGSYRQVAAGLLTVGVGLLLLPPTNQTRLLTLAWAPVIGLIYIGMLGLFRGLPEEVVDFGRRVLGRNNTPAAE